MNLTKYFNFNYLKENIKKSKSIITLLVVAVPLFTILSLVFIFNKSDYTTIINQAEVTIPNIIGMYLIPYVLSVALFEYIYKKSSVDFINSMPINRKTIFITNTIGGIVLITIIQLITLAVALICNALVSTIVIFPSMLVDIFITMWIAYIFMFCATNLAMTLSGTILTQLVLTMIIIFIVPFCMITFEEIMQNDGVKLSYQKETFVPFLQAKQYTLPSKVFCGIDNIYSTVSNTKMLVLGIIYFVLGIHCFQKRKMENAEESFGTNKTHLLVKALTVFPMIVILNILELDMGFNIFVLGLIVVYYFVYDFIIKRKIKFLISIISLVVTLTVSQLIVLVIQGINIENESIQRNDIEKIAICWGESLTYNSAVLKDNLYIDNDEIIDIFYNSAKTGKELNNKDLNPDDSEYKVLELINSNLLLKNGKKVNTIAYLKQEDVEKIVEMLEKDNNYVENVKEFYTTPGVYSNSQHVLSEKTEELNNILRKQIEHMSLNEIRNVLTTYNEFLIKNYYENHTIVSQLIPIDINENFTQIVAEEENKMINDNWEMIKESNISVNFSMNPGNLGYSINEFEKFSGQFNYTESSIRKFIEEHKDDKFDSTQKSYMIRFYQPKLGGNGETLYFFTNKVEEINEIIKLEESYIKQDGELNNYYDTINSENIIY